MGAISLIVFSSSFLPALHDYRISSLAVSIAGISAAILGLYVWFASGSNRKEVARGRSAGKAVWPVRALTESKRYVRGILEVKDGGLAVRLNRGTAEMDWADLRSIELNNSGDFRGERLVIVGSKFGRAELTVLGANAVLEAGSGEAAELVEIIRELSSRDCQP